MSCAPDQSTESVRTNSWPFCRAADMGFSARRTAPAESTNFVSRKLPTRSCRTRSATPESSRSPDSRNRSTTISRTVLEPVVNELPWVRHDRIVVPPPKRERLDLDVRGQLGAELRGIDLHRQVVPQTTLAVRGLRRHPVGKCPPQAARRSPGRHGAGV